MLYNVYDVYNVYNVYNVIDIQMCFFEPQPHDFYLNVVIFLRYVADSQTHSTSVFQKHQNGMSNIGIGPTTLQL